MIIKLSIDCKFVHFANLFKTTDLANFDDPDSFCFSNILGPVQMSIFSCTRNLIPIQVNPNDISLTVDSDVHLNITSQTQFIFPMFNRLKCLQEKIYFSNLCIMFGT